MPELPVVAVAAYLIGSPSGSLLLGRLRGVDIRTIGSGNAGGTNALRTQGLGFAAGVVLIDLGKGLLAAWLASRYGVHAWAGAVAVLAAMAGHVWPVFHGFRGGKGAATYFGGLCWLWPLGAAALVLMVLVLLTFSGIVGVSVISGGLLLVALAWWSGQPLATVAMAAAAGLFLVYTHRSNLQRMWAGTENRFERVRIWHRLARKLRRA